jgi:hypothetical protein
LNNLRLDILMNKAGNSKQIKVDAPEIGRSKRLSLKEVTEDIGAFIHFLKAKADYGITQADNFKNEISSVWMLIANKLDVVFQEGVTDCYLEKEVFSRTLFVVSEPVEKADEVTRRRELIKYFSGCLQQDQLDQITNFLDRLDDDSKDIMLEDYRQFKNNLNQSSD